MSQITRKQKAMSLIKNIILTALIISFASCSTPSDEGAELQVELTAKTTLSNIETDVMDAINEHRVSIGLNNLQYGAVAQSFADSHNTYMIAQGIISHDDFARRASDLSVQANADKVSENLAKDFTSASEVLKAWLESPTHKKVLEGEFTHTAVSVTADADGVLYFTQLFFK